MSNTIAVKHGHKTLYLPFRWWGNDALQVFFNNEWVFATYTGKKNKYGDRVFSI